MVAFNPVWKNFNLYFRTRLMLTQYTPFWCLFHALCLYLLFMTRPTQFDRIQILVTLVSGIDKEKRTLSVCCSKFELEISIPHWWFVCLIWRRFAPARCASFTSLSRLKRRRDCVSEFIRKQQKQVYLSNCQNGHRSWKQKFCSQINDPDATQIYLSIRQLIDAPENRKNLLFQLQPKRHKSTSPPCTLLPNL